MMALPPQASNQKLPCARVEPRGNSASSLLRALDIIRGASAARRCLLLFFFVSIAGRPLALTQQLQPESEGHEREELGVNTYTAPSIAHIFQLLDDLKPLPFDQLKRGFPAPMSASREQKSLIFGGVIADGFLIVAAKRKNVVEELGRVLIREARTLGVGDRVMRHSASLIELGRRADWTGMRKELASTQADVEQAMIELRDEKMAHLISLGGWLRGLEISAGAVEAQYSAERAALLIQPDLVDYFMDELATLPPTIIHALLFEKIRASVRKIEASIAKGKTSGRLTLADVQTIRTQAHQANETIRHVD